jgi:hypothetical protein
MEAAELIGKDVTLKQDKEFTGKVDKLYLPKDITRSRPNDLYFIVWNNGKTGICEEKDLIFEK